jgi:hypothetical protein
MCESKRHKAQQAQNHGLNTSVIIARFSTFVAFEIRLVTLPTGETLTGGLKAVATLCVTCCGQHCAAH